MVKITCRSGEHRLGWLAAFSCFCVQMDVFGAKSKKMIAQDCSRSVFVSRLDIKYLPDFPRLKSPLGGFND